LADPTAQKPDTVTPRILHLAGIKSLVTQWQSPTTLRGQRAILLLDPRSPVTCPDPFRTLVLTPEQTIHFFAVLPLFPEELDCKLTTGMNVLIEQRDRFRITELVNLRRKNISEPCWFGH
jgi:hypothetical protein